MLALHIKIVTKNVLNKIRKFIFSQHAKCFFSRGNENRFSEQFENQQFRPNTFQNSLTHLSVSSDLLVTGGGRGETESDKTSVELLNLDLIVWKMHTVRTLTQQRAYGV